MTIEIVRIDTVHERWARFLIASLKLPDGQIIRREIEEHGRAACVLPYDPDRRTAILVRVFRAAPFHAAQCTEVLEAVAGIIEDDDADAATGARREAFEEAGLRLGPLDHVVTAWTMPGISTERMDLYLAAYTAANRTAAGGGLRDEHEIVAVVEMKLGELAAMADDGRLTDMKTFTLVQTLRLRRPDLFATTFR